MAWGCNKMMRLSLRSLPALILCFHEPFCVPHYVISNFRTQLRGSGCGSGLPQADADVRALCRAVPPHLTPWPSLTDPIPSPRHNSFLPEELSLLPIPAAKPSGKTSQCQPLSLPLTTSTHKDTHTHTHTVLSLPLHAQRECWL